MSHDDEFDDQPTQATGREPLPAQDEPLLGEDAPPPANDAPQTAQDLADAMENLGSAGADEAPVAEEAPAAEPVASEEQPAAPTRERLVSIVESLLFASDKPLSVAQIKQLVGERDGEVIQQALAQIAELYVSRGIQLAEVAGGWQFHTAPDNAAWVQKLLGGRPVRLSRAQLEALAIVAYRQPITRPEIDEIRGVDSGAVLKLLLDRNLIRILGKKEEPGRPLLYGTTREFLEFFHLKDLRDLPTLREFHELTEEHRAQVDAMAEEEPPQAAPRPEAIELPAVDPAEEEALLGELAEAERAADTASAPFKKEKAPPPGGAAPAAE